MSTLLPVTLEPGLNGGPTKRTSKLEASNLLELKKDSMKIAQSSEGGGVGAESFLIPEDKEEDGNSDDIIQPNRSVI